ncbi:hypothetical protein H0H92_007578 [Tricholoma furcatifolium]|nr:hypothetical protein H0H92_007578 [Tricholoma furcatifolium]
MGYSSQSTSDSRALISERSEPPPVQEQLSQQKQQAQGKQRYYPPAVANQPVAAHPVPYALMEALTVDTTHNKRPLDVDTITSPTKRRRIDESKTKIKPILPRIRVPVKTEDADISLPSPDLAALLSNPSPSVKLERRSPSPVLTRRLVTEACAFYPLPPNCRKTLLDRPQNQPRPNPSYIENRRALATKEKKALNVKGLKAVNVLFREDGMVIEWTSPVPVWNDTLLPESMPAVAPGPSSPRLSRPKESPPAPGPSSLLLSDLSPTQTQPHSPSQTKKRRAPASLPIPIPIPRTKHQPLEPTANGPRETIEIIDVDDDGDASASDSFAHTTASPSLRKKRPRDSPIVSPPTAPGTDHVNTAATVKPTELERGVEPGPPIIPETKRKPVPLPPLRRDRELQSQKVQQGRQQEQKREEGPRIAGVDSEQLGSMPVAVENETLGESDRRTMMESPHLRGVDEVQAEVFDVDQEEDEVDEVERGAVEFLNRYIHTFDTDPQALQSAYAEEAMLSCRVLSIPRSGPSPSSSTMPHNNIQHPHLIKTHTPCLITQSLVALSEAYKFLPCRSDDVGESIVDFHYDVAPLGNGVDFLGSSGDGSGKKNQCENGVLVCAHGGIVELESGGESRRGVMRGVDLVFVLQHRRAIKGDEEQEAWPLVVVSQQVFIRGLPVPVVQGLVDDGEEEFPWLH